MTLKIRPAKAADRAQIKAVLLSTFAQTWKPHLSASAHDKASAFPAQVDRYLDTYIEAIYVGCDGGAVLGIVHWFDDFVAALHVTKESQGHGVGSALLLFAERQIAQNHKQVRLETDTFNTQSRAFYKKHGFVEIKHYPDEEWNSGFTTILLEKAL